MWLTRTAPLLASMLLVCAPATAGELLFSITGFAGPEAVRYDPDQDVYFVANFNGETSGDANGFVSRVAPDGRILTLRFMTGTEAHPFDAGRGMVIQDDSLWVADASGVHRFDRRSGEHLQFVDLSAFEPGFPNDIAIADDGSLLVTDTGTSVLYRIAEGQAEVIAKTDFAANGITRAGDDDGDRFLLVPWRGGQALVVYDAASGEFSERATLAAQGRFDGVEVVGAQIYIASQTDESLHVVTDGEDAGRIPLAGRPADIGIDTRRQRILVPYVALNRVDVIALP
jgi:sugar lactone lactonase YvrE